MRKDLGGGRSTVQRIASADDLGEADGTTVLTFAQAIDAARAVAEGRQPARRAPRAEEKPAGMTVREACRRYVEHLLAENGVDAAKDTYQRFRRHVDAELVPPERLKMAKARKAPGAHATLGPKVVNALTHDELKTWRNATIAEADQDDPEDVRRAKDTSNRVLSMLKAALNLAIADDANGILTDKAWRLLKAFPDVGLARHVHLDREQVKRLLNKTDGAFRRLITGLLLTGARPGNEIRFMRVRDFSAATGTVHVANSKTGPRDVVLTAEGIKFFQEIVAGRHPDEWLFTREGGGQWGDKDHYRPMCDAVAAAELPDETVAYSLRHTYASQSIMAGMQAQLLAENMGTSVRMLELNYAKFFATARRQMIEAAAPKLDLDDSSRAGTDIL
ncbi:tyrosine-type recombinase/integrase [Arenibaculum pallidiluteum]|uniref:tyrosine-type recombinase/integrase n=1 Tax=Arenibaculum pallidiluteum TaxID=2812559 RepID=UPI001A95AE1D|nr:tyrosine-type recombinase/integrase [Arenibaculum pallidiluteum]